MRIQNIVFLSLAVMVFTGVMASRAEADVNVNVNFSELNDYGEWVTVPGYGTVWRPDADPGWRPFVYGRWVYSSDGWVWDSDEPFGWIVCHYGNWYYDDDQGWVWLPGYTWSPARVSWYVTDNEIGWAPLYPKARQGYHQNAIHMQWIFAPVPFFTSVEVRSHVEIRANSAPGGGVRAQLYAGPPRKEFVQRSISTPIVSIHLNKVSVTTREKPLIRVEAPGQERPHVEVPVGPRYKRAIVRNEPEPGKPVTVTHEKAAQPPVHQEQTNNPRMREEPRSNAQEKAAQPPAHQEKTDNPRMREEPRSNTQEKAAQPPAHQEKTDNPRIRVETRPATETRPASPEVKAQDKPRNDQNNRGDDNNDKNRGKKKQNEHE